jgi:hypothetical protein
MDWVINNWTELLQGATYVVAGASALVMLISKATATTVDDDIAGWLGKLKKALNWLALNK